VIQRGIECSIVESVRFMIDNTELTILAE